MPHGSPTLCADDKDRARSANSEAAGAGETSESRIAKALAHPLRARILQRLGERVASPGDLAVELGRSARRRLLPRAHAARLRLRRARAHRARRGALQHFYKATARPNLDDAQWRTLPSGLRGELTGETISELVSDLARRPTPARSRTRRSCSRARRWSSTSKASRSSTSCWPRRTSRHWRSPPRAPPRNGGRRRLPDRARRAALQARELGRAEPVPAARVGSVSELVGADRGARGEDELFGAVGDSVA